MNFNIGRNWVENSAPRLFQNTRGVYVKGTLLKNFSFSTAFVENQARFSAYENEFIANHGEFYPNASTVQQNGVVPGGGRRRLLARRAQRRGEQRFSPHAAPAGAAAPPVNRSGMSTRATPTCTSECMPWTCSGKPGLRLQGQGPAQAHPPRRTTAAPYEPSLV